MTATGYLGWIEFAVMLYKVFLLILFCAGISIAWADRTPASQFGGALVSLISVIAYCYLFL